MADVVGPLEESDDEDDPDARADGGTEATGALGFASKEAAKNRVKSTVFDRFPTKRLAFAAGAASGSALTLVTVLVVLFL